MHGMLFSKYMQFHYTCSAVVRTIILLQDNLIRSDKVCTIILLQDNLIRSDKVSSSTDTEIDFTRLDVCTPYWFVVRTATCGDAASSAPTKVDLDDTKLFELSCKLKDDNICTSFIQTESEQTVSNIEDSMNSTLRSTDCGAFAVSCFAALIVPLLVPGVMHPSFTSGTQTLSIVSLMVNLLPSID